MKRQIFKTIFLVLLVISAGKLFPATAQDEITKTYHKEYAAGDGTVLTVLNKYGEVNFEDWDKKSVVIDVTITVDNPNREYAQKMLEYLDVDFSQTEKHIEARTMIDDRFSRLGWNRWGREGKKFSINYVIHAPASIDVELMNKYGNTFVSTVSGHALLSVKYGNLKVNKLTRSDTKPLNMIEVAYGKGVVDEAGWIKLDIKYSKIEIGTATAIASETAYSKLSADNVRSLVSDSKYDQYTIGKIKNLVLDISYGHVKVDELTGKLSLDSRYTGVEVDRIPAGFSDITIDNHYGGINLGIDPDASYKLKGEARYCKILVPESANLSRIIESTSATYEGIIGNEKGPSSTISIETSHGGVKLY